jgi:hypothetical protein
MVKGTLQESIIRLIAVIYIIFAVAAINGLLAGGVMLAHTRGDVFAAKWIFAVALTLRVLGLGVLFALVGIGPVKDGVMRLFLCGYVSGMCTAFVSGFCLFYYSVITHNDVALLSQNFFPFWRILLAGTVTGGVLISLKIICWLLHFTYQPKK